MWFNQCVSHNLERFTKRFTSYRDNQISGLINKNERVGQRVPTINPQSSYPKCKFVQYCTPRPVGRYNIRITHLPTSHNWVYFAGSGRQAVSYQSNTLSGVNLWSVINWPAALVNNNWSLGLISSGQSTNTVGFFIGYFHKHVHYQEWISWQAENYTISKIFNESITWMTIYHKCGRQGRPQFPVD